MDCIDVAFETAGGIEWLVVVKIMELEVPAPAKAGIGVLAEFPADGNAERGSLVAWWRSCDEAEASAFELRLCPFAPSSIRTCQRRLDPTLEAWLRDTRGAIDTEVRRFAKAVGGKLTRHVAAKLAENRRLADEASDLHEEKLAFMRDLGVDS